MVLLPSLVDVHSPRLVYVDRLTDASNRITGDAELVLALVPIATKTY